MNISTESAYRYVGITPPKDPKVGDVYYDGTDIKIYNGTSTWITTANTINTINYCCSTPPKVKYPKNCINCGATLHSYKCEYCGTEY